MKTALRVAALTLLTTAFYAYVGHLVPQKETYPPESVALRADMSTDEMVAAGEEVVGGKGTCLSCHTIGSDKPGRFPDLGGIGSRAGGRVEGMSDIEYLAQSLYEPNAYIVEGFNPGMIPVSKPPISLSQQEILCVIAYLQSQGGTPTVTMQTELPYAATPVATTTAPAGAAVASTDNAGVDATQLMVTYACVTCHNMDTPDVLVGPSLYDAGKRLSKPALYESIMEPDATVAEGFPAGVMSATLQGMEFYDKVTSGQLKAIVDYLESHKGNK